MGISEFLKSLFSPSKADNYVVHDGRGLYVFIRCDKCGEKIQLRLRKTDEIQRNQNPKEFQFFVQKMVMGTECFNRMETRIEFDKNYNVVNSQISNGKLITKDEYEQNAL